MYVLGKRSTRKCICGKCLLKLRIYDTFFIPNTIYVNLKYIVMGQRRKK